MSNSLFHTYKQLMPVGIWFIFSLLAVWGAFVGQMVDSNRVFLVLNQFHYIAFFLLVCLVGSFFLFRKYYKYVVIFALFAGIFDIACFSGSNFIVTLGGKNSHFSLQPLSLFVASVFFVINFKRISDWVKEKSEPPVAVISKEEKNAFIEKYENYSDEELNTIRSDTRYLPSARIAAEHIISERVAARTKPTI